MKFSSVSLIIAATLAAIPGSAFAAPGALYARALEYANLFIERDVGVYSPDSGFSLLDRGEIFDDLFARGRGGGRYIPSDVGADETASAYEHAATECTAAAQTADEAYKLTKEGQYKCERDNQLRQAEHSTEKAQEYREKKKSIGEGSMKGNARRAVANHWRIYKKRAETCSAEAVASRKASAAAIHQARSDEITWAAWKLVEIAQDSGH